VLFRSDGDRRQFLSNLAITSGAFLPAISNAEDNSAPDGLVSRSKAAELLHAIPTFTIVDQRGVPYMVVGEDAKVTGYFFLDYKEAKRILDVARTSADKSIRENRKDPDLKQEGPLVNPWKQARISTVPLDVAVTLVTKSMYASSKGGGNYFMVAPSPEDIDHALAITGKDDLAEGKVPLFYYENFTIDCRTGSSETPLYFRKNQLEAAFRRENSKAESLPEPKVTELFAVLAAMTRPGGTDQDLASLIFEPLPESVKRQSECERKGGSESPFIVGERNIVL